MCLVPVPVELTRQDVLALGLDFEVLPVIIVEGRDGATPGETVVALIGDEATVKKYYPGENGTVRLQPANPTMQPIFVNADDLRIRGVVVGLMRHYR